MTPMLQSDVVVISYSINAENLMTFGQQQPGKMEADEAG